MSTDPDTQSQLLVGGGSDGSVRGGFAIEEGGLVWRDAGFEGGRARFCLSGGNEVLVEGRAGMGKGGCVEVGLGVVSCELGLGLGVRVRVCADFG